MSVRLVRITNDNVGDVVDLAVAPEQAGFVATNAWSLAQAYAEYDIAWPRAVTVDDTVVGFLMLEVDPEEKNGRPFWLWRLMIDAGHQRQGYGSAALDLAIVHLRTLGAEELYTSWVPGDDGPGGFYARYGFEPTGELDDDEIVAVLRIDSQPRRR